MTGQISARLSRPSPATSRPLVDARIITRDKRGTWSYHALMPPALMPSARH